jgi:DNA-binding NarL/FixJ family response regulator
MWSSKGLIELLDAVEAALSGNMYLSPAISRSVVQSYLNRPTSPARPAENPLTPKEREVLQLLTEGLRSKEIAQRLTARPRTTETHRHNLMKKLEIHTLPGLVKYAICKEIISEDD